MDQIQLNELIELARSIYIDEFNFPITTENTIENLKLELLEVKKRSDYKKEKTFEIIEHVTECFSGDFFHKFPISEKEDELDVISMGFNTYIEELKDVMVSKSELEKTNQDLIKANDLAEHLSKVKDIFIANMSHEIRTPLNGIIGFANLLLATENDEIKKKYLNQIANSGNILLDIVNNVLDISKIEAGKMIIQKEKIHFVSLINQFLESFQIQLQEKNLSLILNVNEMEEENIITDKTKLFQILNNLIGNAIKFTKNNGRIEVNGSIKKNEQGNLTLKCSIKDSGIGIPKDKLQNIFDPFFQIQHELNKQYSGTGLGLSITKKIVECLGGEILVESEEGKGSVFEFIIPVESNLIEILKDELTSKEKINILVAEDNKINQMLIKAQLERHDFEVDIAENGKEAVEMYSKNKYNIILMDIMMPEMDGFEASQIIRSMDIPKSQIPIIVLTADVSENCKKRCNELSINAYFSKPYEFDLLLETINSLAKRS